MEPRDYIRILRRGWVLIVLTTLLGIAAAATYSILRTPEYAASSKVFVSTQAGSSVAELAQGNNFSVQRVKTYSDLVSAPIVLRPVLDRLDLGQTPEQIAPHITASAPLDTSIIEIGVTHRDPATAAALADGIAASLTEVVEEIERPAVPEGEAVINSPVKLTTIQRALTPTAPISPNVPLNLAIGALVGLAAGLGVAVLRETLETRIRNERDIEQLVDTPILGGIVFDPKAQQRPLIVQADPRSPRAESFRTLRTNLQFLDLGRAERSFVVTSSIQSEGKSTTTANLAIALSDAGARVLLVDADLRRPRLAQYMDLEGGVGLTDVLIGHAELDDVVQPWGRGQLHVLPAGRIPPNPSELLGSLAMVSLIQRFTAGYDVVLFDAPPLLPVTDAAVLAKNVGGTILVVAAGRTHKNQVEGAVTALENVGAPLSGVVMTMLPTKGPDAYDYGRYGYGYGYGEDGPTTGSVAAVRPAPSSGRGQR